MGISNPVARRLAYARNGPVRKAPSVETAAINAAANSAIMATLSVAPETPRTCDAIVGLAAPYGSSRSSAS